VADECKNAIIDMNFGLKLEAAKTIADDRTL